MQWRDGEDGGCGSARSITHKLKTKGRGLDCIYILYIKLKDMMLEIDTDSLLSVNYHANLEIVDTVLTKLIGI